METKFFLPYRNIEHIENLVSSSFLPQSARRKIIDTKKLIMDVGKKRTLRNGNLIALTKFFYRNLFVHQNINKIDGSSCS